MADRDNKLITIDSANQAHPGHAAQTAAHEAGHAQYEPDPYVDPTGKTRSEYVQANLDRHLKDEGEATLTNAEARQEIWTTADQTLASPVRIHQAMRIPTANTRGANYLEAKRKTRSRTSLETAKRQVLRANLIEITIAKVIKIIGIRPKLRQKEAYRDPAGRS